MYRVALLLILVVFFVQPVPARGAAVETGTSPPDLLITLSFKMSMAGTVPPQIPASVREQESVMVVKVKGAKVALTARPLHLAVPVDITTVSDAASGDTVAIDHVRKMYTRTTAEQQAQMLTIGRKMLESQNGPLPKERPVAKPTGRTSQISGYSVEEYVAETPKVRYTYWIAPSLKKYVSVTATTLMYAGGPMGVVASLWQPDPAKLPGVSIQTVFEYRREGYTQVATTTVQSFREVRLDADDFAIPSGYQEFSTGRH